MEFSRLELGTSLSTRAPKCPDRNHVVVEGVVEMKADAPQINPTHARNW
jgi:hypothetical protein